jgi:WD40 repeat protein
VRFTPDGRRLISAGRNDRLVKLWDLTTRKGITTRHAHEGPIENLVIAPGGETLATVGGDDYARLWNVADLTPGNSFRAASNVPVYGLAFSADGTRLATAEATGHVIIWGLATGESSRSVRQVHVDDAQAVAFLDDDRVVVSADGRGTLRVTDAATGSSIANLNGHSGKIWGISVSPDRKTFATVSSDGTIKLWDARSWQRSIRIPVAQAGGPLAFTPDGNTLILAEAVGGKWANRPGSAVPHMIDANLEVTGFDSHTGAERFRRVPASGVNTWGCALTLTADGRIALFSIVSPRTTIAWEAATGKRLATADDLEPFSRSHLLGVHSPLEPLQILDPFTGGRQVLRGTVCDLFAASAPDARVVALRSSDKLSVWDMATNQVRRTRSGVHGGWSTMVLSPDSTILATGGGIPRGQIEFWDLSTLELLDSVPAHAADLGDLDFTPDGKVLASLSLDSVLKLWDVAARVELLTLEGPFRALPSLRFSPDGKSLAFRGTEDGKAWVYVVSTVLPQAMTSEESP